MLQCLSGNRLRLINLKVLCQSASLIINLALHIGLEACGQAKSGNMLVIPQHGNIVHQVDRIGTCLNVEIVRIVFQTDRILVS